MIKGMTGFGSAQLSAGKIKAIVEIKSVNHRYLDLSFYLPIGFASIENQIRQIIQRNVERGRITISVKITEKPVQTIIFNKDVVNKYIKYAKTIKKDFGLDNDLTMSDLAKMPGVFETKETFIKVEDIWLALEKSIRKALHGLIVMRKREGKCLLSDVSDKLKKMAEQVKKITARSKFLLKENRKKMTVDEYNSYRKSCDINEELARLRHFIDEIKSFLKSNVASGKKIDFIAQEMQREINTVGSKIQDKVISNSVISVKSKIEKIREQAQNIE